MELRVDPVNVPEKIDFNYEQIKSELLDICQEYKMTVYTDDNIREAKTDKALLNRTKKMLNDERIRRQKEYMKPFDDFKGKIDDLINIIDDASNAINKQVKEYENDKKEKKTEEINKLIDEFDFPEEIDRKLIFDEHWLNTTYKLSKIEEDLEKEKKSVAISIQTLRSLINNPLLLNAALESYYTTLDLEKAVRTAEKMKDVITKTNESNTDKKYRYTLEFVGTENQMNNLLNIFATVNVIKKEELNAE